MERVVHISHRANRGLVDHEPRKVGADDAAPMAVSVPIERSRAVLSLLGTAANPVSSIFYLLSSIPSSPPPLVTRVCVRCVLLFLDICIQSPLVYPDSACRAVG